MSGDLYTGEAAIINEEEVKEGKGVLKFNNGDICLGNWKNDLLHGQGIYIFKNGCRYEGEFSNGSRNGFGILKSSS